MYFAIRDDDIAYFTKPEDLEKVYSFVSDGCISLSVVANTVPIHKDSVFPYGGGIEYKEYPIFSNKELITYLKEKSKEGRYDILLHGFSHEYKKIDGDWEPELKWKSEDRMFTELSSAKVAIENALDCSISVLVAPRNSIDQRGINVCEKLGMDYSDIIKFNDRKIEPKYIVSFLKRYLYRAVYGGTYGGLLQYNKHNELFAYPIHSYEKVFKHYQLCKQHNFPLVIFTHYHELLKNGSEMENLKKIYDVAMNDGCELIGLSELFCKLK